MTPEQMKKARTRLGLTQCEIAEKLDLSERFWLYRETGERPITQWLARAIRDLLKNPKKSA